MMRVIALLVLALVPAAVGFLTPCLNTCPSPLHHQTPSSPPSHSHSRPLHPQHHKCRPLVPRETLLLAKKEGDGPDEGELTDRFIATVPYALPLLDGLDFGKFIFTEYPGVGMVANTLFGSLRAFWGTPFVPLGFFLGCILLARNNALPREIRFNIQQAILLDIFLVLASLSGSGARFLGLMEEPFTNLCFMTLVLCLSYSVVECVRGRVPNGIPLISQLAVLAMGPY